MAPLTRLQFIQFVECASAVLLGAFLTQALLFLLKEPLLVSGVVGALLLVLTFLKIASPDVLHAPLLALLGALLIGAMRGYFIALPW